MKLFQWYAAEQDEANRDEQIYLYLLREYKNTFDAIEMYQYNSSAKFTTINKAWMDMKIRTQLFKPCDPQFDKINIYKAHYIIESLLRQDV